MSCLPTKFFSPLLSPLAPCSWATAKVDEVAMTFPGEIQVLFTPSLYLQVRACTALTMHLATEIHCTVWGCMYIWQQRTLHAPPCMRMDAWHSGLAAEDLAPSRNDHVQ